ncbi:MAG: hypothetical protein ACI4DK_01315 [Lachnospiraceae bacterium]
MQFSNKLNFLMNITNTSNKELAEGISVDRSLISLLRSGKRKTPRNQDHIMHMASFFAKRCSADFQFHALAEMLEKPELRPGMPTDALSEKLYNWMRGDAPMIEHIFENITQSPLTSHTLSEPNPAFLSSQQIGETNFYYGIEGMRESLRYLFYHIQHTGRPGTIYLVSDLNMEWLFEDHHFMSEFSNALYDIFQKGFRLCHIMPSLNYMNRYVESLRYWLPIYASGNAEVYYYPRLRDNLYRRSLTIFEGQCVQASTAIGNSPDLITVNSINPTLINAYQTQFEHELSLCRQALISHTDPADFIFCFRELLDDNSPVIHKVAKPTPYTLPRKYLDEYIRQEVNPNWAKPWEMFRDDADLFEQKISRTGFIELCPLASPEDIRAGKILLGTNYQVTPTHPVYTPETYAMHLQHILELMDKYENYHFIPVKATERQDYNLYTSESGLTLLIKNSPSPLMLEIRRPELSQACHEYLMRTADLVGYTGIRRTKIRMQIKELIQELLR